MDFFEQFEQARWEFTYGAPDNEAFNALQVGLVAHFYIDQGYLPEKRQAMAEAFSLYDREFGEKLKWGYYNNPKKAKPYNQSPLAQKKSEIADEKSEALYLFWASEIGLLHTSNYRVRVASPAAWFEYIHGDISNFSLYLPVSELEGKGRERLERLLISFCEILNPMHGLMGLGIQNCRDEHKYQHLEYEISQEFLAIDVGGADTDKHLRNGIRSINWYTFINDEWLTKLGGAMQLREQLADSRISLLPYDGGLIVRAGEWPELGWVKQTPYPELYVAVNRAFKPIRAPKIDSPHYGSICGEIRYDEISTAQWLARFDVDLPAMAQGASGAGVEAELDRQRIEVWSSEFCPHSGQWGCWSGGALHHVRIRQGFPLPEQPEGQRVKWSLLERDDGGSCFVTSEGR